MVHLLHKATLARTGDMTFLYNAKKKKQKHYRESKNMMKQRNMFQTNKKINFHKQILMK